WKRRIGPRKAYRLWRSPLLGDRMFRNGETQAGRELDAAITEAKSARSEAMRELHEHEVTCGADVIKNSLLLALLPLFVVPPATRNERSRYPWRCFQPRYDRRAPAQWFD